MNSPNRAATAMRVVVMLVLALLTVTTGAWAAVPALFFGTVALDEIAHSAVTDVSETFKRVYLMAADAVPDATPLTAQYNRTRKFKAGPDGLYFNVKLETGGAVANVRDGRALPSPSRPKRRQGKSSIAHSYTVVAIGGQSIPLTEDTRNAFVSNLEDQLEDGMVRVKNDQERQYNGDGRGILCVLETVAGAPTYGVEDPYGQTNAGPGTMLLIEGMEVAVINPADGSERGRTKIADAGVDPDTEEVTLAAAVAGAAIGDYLVLCNDSAAAGSDQDNNYTREAAGIGAVTNSGDEFQDIDGALHARWNASVMSNGGVARPITEKLIAQLEARIRAKSGKKPDLFYTTRGISIELQDQLAGLRRFEGETATLKGGYEGVTIGRRKVLEGDWCPKGRFFAMNTGKDVVGMMDLAKMGYVDLDGAKLHRIEGRHAYRADLWFPHNAIYFSRSAFGRLEDLEDDNTIVR